MEFKDSSRVSPKIQGLFKTVLTLSIGQSWGFTGRGLLIKCLSIARVDKKSTRVQEYRIMSVVTCSFRGRWGSSRATKY